MKKIPSRKKGNHFPEKENKIQADAAVCGSDRPYGSANAKKLPFHCARKEKIQAAALGVFAAVLAVAALSGIQSIGQAYDMVSCNGIQLGAVKKSVDVAQAALEGRRMAAAETEDVLYTDVEYSIEESRTPFVSFLSEEELSAMFAEQILAEPSAEKKSAYVLRMGAHMVVLEDLESVAEVLDRVRENYDGNEKFCVEFTGDDASGDESFSAEIVLNEEEDAADGEISADPEDAAQTADDDGVLTADCTAGASRLANRIDLAQDGETGYVTGLIEMEYVQQIEISPCVAGEEEILSVQEAAAQVTKEQESNKLYTVKDGDCLSVIAENCQTSVDAILALNDGLEDDSTIIVPGDELIVAVPEAWLSVRTKEGVVYGEEYEAEPQIIENDSWYTTQEAVLQEGKPGYREVNAVVTYENGMETDRETVSETVITAAEAEIVERGTKIPPTYEKPINGGTFTSGFKVRWGRMHKGVDWATPVGTPVYASSDGVVATAGQLNGYGYCIYINHEDGRQTRYGHLSEILVSPGQSVKQGELIAKSGNSGRSTGPHLHFEILINGTQVDPLAYLD